MSIFSVLLKEEESISTHHRLVHGFSSALNTPPKFKHSPSKKKNRWLEDKPFLLGPDNFSGGELLNFRGVRLFFCLCFFCLRSLGGVASTSLLVASGTGSHFCSPPLGMPRFLGMPVRSNHCQIRMECVLTQQPAFDSKFIRIR